jgi:hypothetical protein
VSTSRKVAGSILNEIIECFDLLNLSSHIIALGLIQTLEMSIKDLPEGKALPEHKADKLDLNAICEPIVYSM